VRYHIDDALFSRVPDFRRGVVAARGCDNSTCTPVLEGLLRERIARIEADPDITPEDPRIDAWTRLYKNYPSPRGERVRPSVWSLVRRISRGDGQRIPFSSPLVAISNLVSLTYLVPSGLVDADRVSGDLALGFAAGTESFLAFGRTERVTVERGEVIYYDDATGEVMCRAWNSRGSRSTGIHDRTTRAVIDVDCLTSVIPDSSLREATEWVASLVGEFCGGKTEVFYLDRTQPQVHVEV
jgi:DNA/RNA-binding domain of Phe-tRNA-synthetase-like protein